MVSGLKDLEEKISRAVLAIRKLYPDTSITRVKIGKNKVRVYGRAGKHWFKIIISSDGKARVYSSSRSVESVARRRLEEGEAD